MTDSPNTCMFKRSLGQLSSAFCVLEKVWQLKMRQLQLILSKALAGRVAFFPYLALSTMMTGHRSQIEAETKTAYLEHLWMFT